MFYSGIFNFLGVITGGLAVAYAIVHLLPVDLLISINTTRGMAMVFALLTAAIAWNLGTWYFGLPASSSHTLIGAILGVGVANSLIHGTSLSHGINWSKAIDVGASLLASPLVGALLARRADRHPAAALPASQQCAQDPLPTPAGGRPQTSAVLDPLHADRVVDGRQLRPRLQ
ncbi:inorganic phosphate transporter [Chromobacterium haemolyticum]|nr:inorganic phosphate transporter [Chromobacterium haemolyticum]